MTPSAARRAVPADRTARRTRPPATAVLAVLLTAFLTALPVAFPGAARADGREGPGAAGHRTAGGAGAEAAGARAAGASGTRAAGAAGGRAPKRAKAIVSLTFDDGDATHPAVARMLERHGMRGTFYVNTGTVGHERKLTRRGLAAIARAGHEIGGHTLTHLRLPELTVAEQRAQICDDRRKLVSWGYRPVTLAYPFGSVDARAEAAARRCGYDAARDVGGLREFPCPACPAAESLPPRDRHAIRTAGSAGPDTPLRRLKQQVFDAEKIGGVLPLVFHRVCEDCGDYSVSPKLLEDFLGWLATRKSHGTVVRPLGEAVGARYRPLPPSAAR
ncbi:polysaccharide deacetylase family protein [Streptosporangium sp. NPDC004379]|uniref:polysaccharide deacetylase family protein n=1 Tax=Streptosporangium sp. NPDC004379 TaxID=3366189 RepID=UPI00368B70D1